LKLTTKCFSASAGQNKLIFRTSTAVEILYAVYEVVGKFLGFSFFEPGVDKHSASIELKDGKLIANRRPVIANSGFIQGFSFSGNSCLIGDCIAKNKLNYLMTWMKYYDEMPEAMKEFYKVRGIQIESGHHNFNYWIPPEKYYRKHPEFFAVINGKKNHPDNR
jgi:hypothetical protein